MLHAFFLHDLKSLRDLFFRHSILGVSGVVHNAVAHFKISARIVAAAHGLRQISDRFFHRFDMRDVIQIDDAAQLLTVCKFFRRRIIGRKHDLMSGNARRLGQQKLRHGRTVASASVFF